MTKIKQRRIQKDEDDLIILNQFWTKYCTMHNRKI